MSESEIYYAAYCNLDIESGDSLINVDGNSVVIGAELTLVQQTHVTDRGKEVERIVLGRGDQAMGFLPDNAYRRVAKYLERGWTCRAFASADVFDKRINSHWVEAAVICYDPRQAAVFEPFVDMLTERIAKGEHPAVDLSPKELALLVESEGTWADVKEQKLPKLPKGSAYYKTKRTMTENMALAAAEGNKGCYVGLFVVVFVIIFSIIWFLFLR